MGTRHLIAVQLDGEYKIAQYGQWDGYPSGQGATVLDFLNNWDRPKFEEKLRAASYLSEDDETDEETNLQEHGIPPEFHRDTGAEILELVQNRGPGIRLTNRIDFAADSLFCEWAYVIDLDKNVLEVFKGFQMKPPPEGDRFANATTDDPFVNKDYYPIRKIASYSLDSLPSQQQLEEECEGPQ